MTIDFFTTEERARPVDVVSIENALVDLLVRASDADLVRLGLTKGIMRLVESDVQREVLSNLGNNSVEVELGGSAANALRGLAALGLKTCYSSTIGNDPYGEAFKRRLAELSITNRLISSDTNHTGTCLVVVTPDGERTMNTHLGACRLYAKHHVPVDDICKSRILFTTGYIWDTPEQIEAIDHAIAVARQNGTKIALDVADPFAVRRSQHVFWKLINEGVLSVLFANAEEANMLVGAKGAEAAKILAEKIPVVAVKDGPAGAYVAYKGKVSHVPAMSTTVVDTTGAGDMFAGGFLYGLLNGLSVELCGAIGSMLASDTISYLGVRLSSDISRRVKELIG